MSSRLLAWLIVPFAALVLAPSAMGGQILFAHSEGSSGASDIWIMNDDGSNARPFITRSQIPDGTATALSAPAVDESSGAVLFNGYVGTFGGTNGLAVYVLKDGQITRLSRGGAQSGEGTTADEEPEPFGNGSFIFRGQSCTGTSCGVTVFETQSMSDTAADGQLETRSSWPTACDGSGSLGTPAPNPVNPDQVAYSGCLDQTTFDTVRQVLVSGPSRAGERVISGDDDPQKSVTWRADGGQLAAIERNNQAGIFVYDPTDDAQDKRRVVAAPSFDSTLAKVTFMGADTLLFDREIGSEKRLFRVSTSCTDCDVDTGVTVVKADPGQSSADPEWTPRASLQAPGTGGGGGGGDGDGDGGGGGGGGGAGSGVGPDPGASYARKQKLKRRRVVVKASCVLACRYTTRGTNVIVGKRTFATKAVSRILAAGQKATLRIKLSRAAVKAGRKALRRGKKVKAELVLSAYYNGGTRVGGPLIRKVTLR